MAICGLSAEYELADVEAHLAVPLEEWFEMCAVQRADYVKKFNQMTVNLVPRVFRLFGQRGNAGKTLGTSNFITAGFLR